MISVIPGRIITKSDSDYVISEPGIQGCFFWQAARLVVARPMIVVRVTLLRVGLIGWNGLYLLDLPWGFAEMSSMTLSLLWQTLLI